MALTIQITQQFAKIGIDITKPQLELAQPRAAVNTSTQQPQMSIHQGVGTLEIDGDDSRSALGHKTTAHMMESISSQVRQMMINTIGDIAETGHELGDIEKHRSIADIAAEHAFRPEPISDVGPFSNQNVHVSYTPHPTTIDWTPGHVSFDPETHETADVNYQPGTVSVYVKQKNWVHYEPKGTYLNMTF